MPCTDMDVQPELSACYESQRKKYLPCMALFLPLIISGSGVIPAKASPDLQGTLFGVRLNLTDLLMASIAEIEFILYVADQARSRDFYKDVLEIHPSLDVPGMTEFRLNAYCKLGLMPENGIAQILKNAVPHPASGSGIPRAELYLYVEDIPAAYARALQSGAKEISPSSMRSWGDTVAYVADPDGHILALASKEKNSEGI